MTSSLASTLSEAKLARLASERVMWRARMIQTDDIENVELTDARLTATIRGTLPYRTELWLSDKGKLSYSCSCPQGEDGKFCKHCAALALTLHPGEQSHAFSPHRDARAREVAGETATYARSLSHETLVELVLDAAKRDDVTALRLVTKDPVAPSSPAFDAKSWRSRLTAAYGPKSRCIEYRAAARWAENILSLLDELRDTLNDEVASDVVSLYEHAHARTEQALHHVDDSDGWITMMSGEVADGHLEACRLARPSPTTLARRLATFELDDELDTFRGAAERYAEVLGDVGLNEYRRVIDDAAAFEDPKTTDRWSSRRFRVKHARVGIALATGDVDELIAQLASDRPLPDDYLTIVNALVKAGRVNDAIDWAHRGLNSDVSSEHYRGDLRDRVVGLLYERGDVDQVRDLRLQGFRASPTPKALRQYLAVCDTKERTAERSALFEWLTDRAARNREPQSANDLSRILLAEGEIDAAYAAAERFGCGRDIRQTLARALERSRPREALNLYQLDINEFIEKKRRQEYRAATTLLGRVKNLYGACHAENEWTFYIASVLATHKAKTSLIGMIRDAGLVAPL